VPKLTVTVITLNEADRIEECLESVGWADEIIVVDSGSTDGTPALARHHGARVIIRDWPGYSPQKNFAAAEAANDWILSLDADERVTPELATEIRQTLATQPTVAGFRMPRVTWHLGRWIRTTDWYPDFQLRLYDRRRARWADRRVHESVTVDGPAGRLRHDLQHYAYRDLAHHHRTMERYTMLAAEEMQAAGRRANAFDLAVHPFAAFLRNYLFRAGVLDGMPGFIVSVMNAYYVFLKFARLWELERKARKPGRGDAFKPST
jgi:glycosyltransferase involved in cell wall biosynthesis